MANKQFQTRLKAAVKRLQDAFYSNSGDAFCHWAMQTYLELDDDTAFEACDVGGRADRGLDAYWHDQDQHRIVLAQAKYKSAKGKVGPEAVVDLERAYRWLAALGREDSKRAKRELRAAAREVAELRADDSGYPIELLCFASRDFTPEAIDQAEAFNAEHNDDGVSLQLVGLSRLEEAVREQNSRLDKPPIEVTLHLEKFFAFDPDDAPKTIVASVNVKELAAIERKYHYRIFQRNVRYFLNANNRVNKGIVTTLSDSEGRSRFWYYNNGIAIVCDDIKITSSTGDGTAVAKVKNLQIVNGCQTTTTLGELADQLAADDEGSPAYVLVRFIESDDLALQGEISRFNNKQSAVKDRDLSSNDDVQARLEVEFGELEPPWFFERKRGQWEAEVKPSAAQKRRFGDRRIDNEAAAQSAYAFWHDPAVARARKRMLFVKKIEDPNGLYEQVFTDSTTPEWLLLPFRVQQHVARKKRAYMRELKTALEAERPNVHETRLLGKQWLKFADQIIIAVIRTYWEQQLDIRRVGVQRALLSEATFDPAVTAAYGLAVRDLNPFFRQKIQDYDRRGEPFDAANYVKGNWSEVRAWIHDQIEFRGVDAEFAEIAIFADA